MAPGDFIADNFQRKNHSAREALSLTNGGQIERGKLTLMSLYLGGGGRKVEGCPFFGPAKVINDCKGDLMVFFSPLLVNEKAHARNRIARCSLGPMMTVVGLLSTLIVR